MNTAELINKYRDTANDYNKRMRELATIKKKKAIEILSYRASEDCKSYADAERKWEITEYGQKEIENEYYCRGLTKILKSIDLELRAIRDDNWSQV